jgi:hypothetical protein
MRLHLFGLSRVKMFYGAQGARTTPARELSFVKPLLLAQQRY